MNLLCPNCQKMLTVPEEYAGQMMQCPLCRGTFTMPALPQSAGAGMPPPSSSSPAGPDSFTIPLPPSGVYQLPPDQQPGVAPPPPPDSLKKGTPKTSPPPLYPEPAAGTYARAIPVRINPRFLFWLVPVCLILALVLSFFPWKGVYPGGVAVLTQNGWQTAFGGWSATPVFDKTKRIPIDKEADRPGSSLFMMVALILLALLVLFAVAVLVVQVAKLNVPPALQAPLRWQGLILGGVALLVFVVILIPTFTGFPINKAVTGKMEDEIKKVPAAVRSDEDSQLQQMQRGVMLATFPVQSTLWFWLAFILILLAALGGLLQFWMLRRGAKPWPKLEFSW